MDGESYRIPNQRSALSKENLSRLAAPKTEHPKFIPDKPSVYWLDYIADPTPHELIDPKQLHSYYKKFTTPRLMRLSKPKIRDSAEDLIKRATSSTSTGIPISALKYAPSDRIKELAEPRSTKSQSEFIPKAAKITSLRGTRSCSMNWPNKSIKTGHKKPIKVKVRARSRL